MYKHTRNPWMRTLRPAIVPPSHLRPPHIRSSLPKAFTRPYNFASTKFCSAFYPQPLPVDTTSVRALAVSYLRNFDRQEWYRDPVTTLLNGKVREGSSYRPTFDNFGNENGSIHLADDRLVNEVIRHAETYIPPKKDFRNEVRALEGELLGKYAHILVANQALDFLKQDGLTEIEESTQASVVERFMNDMLFQDEEEGILSIQRSVAFVGCVSNFSNYLDLFRKVLRNIELGVPVIIFSRTNTTQHMYRWSQILLKLLKQFSIPEGMVTFLACEVKHQREIMNHFKDSPMYFTGSRAVAAAIKEVCPKLMASTGGPNTMVVSDLTEKNIVNAVRTSATIENSGQCTALRHLVVSKCNEAQVISIFDEVKQIQSPVEALEQGEFAAVFKNSPFDLTAGYKRHPSGLPVAYKIDNKLPPSVDEHWRKVYLDVTEIGDLKNDDALHKLSDWLYDHQPISIAVNMSTFEQSYVVAKDIFEKTALVVYTIGSSEKPALTAQARPQDAEVFGEFPSRDEMHKITKFPVIVPSSTPSYNSYYTKDYLLTSAKVPLPDNVPYLQSLISKIEKEEIRGYINILVNYLIQSQNPKIAQSNLRTALWGLQSPPPGKTTVFRLNIGGCFDYLGIHMLPFLMMEGGENLMEVSCDKEDDVCLKKLGVIKGSKVVKESEAEFKKRMEKEQHWNVVSIESSFDFPLAGQFVSLLLPLGHIKSTLPNDKRFLEIFTQSKKWFKIKQC